ncbi:MAG: type II secretion system protein E [Desulfobulbaceae bacterium A2]|nr:MAG: type II secretion system protein E [Desulfobulbaceae bacterium A2]
MGKVQGTTFLNSEEFLELLVRQKLLTVEQQRFLVLQQDRHRQQLMRDQGGRRREDLVAGTRRGKYFPDLLDIILSLHIDDASQPGRPLSEDTMLRAVATHFELPFRKLDPLDLEIDTVTKTIPQTFAISHLILPVRLHDGKLEAAICAPETLASLEEVERAIQVQIVPIFSSRSDISKILADFFGFQTSISAAESQFGGRDSVPVDIGNLEQYVRIAPGQELSSSDQHIKAAVNHLFSYALEQRASDIHIEPKRESCLVRFRIDGVLHVIYRLPKVVHAAISSRIKTLARMDIAEKRRPQDGRIKIGHGSEGREAEVRVSTVPVAFGEKVVMRLQSPDILFQDLNTLGFSRRDYAVFTSLFQASHGIVLVTGPTGSGKSTTLYSTLKKVVSSALNIVTIEDPVEMVDEDFNQIAVQPLIDVTFATILRNILRQDPDIIMVGEIRDEDTAVNAVQAALTGHLVFSTLHTNDAVSSVVRLLDLGVEPFLIASTLLGALAQRLVRRICPHCRESYTLPADELRRQGLAVPENGEVRLWRGKGCRQCRNTGYLGRMGIFELFPMTEGMRKLVAARAPTTELKQLAVREGMTTLREDAWRKVRQGLTTVEEALRATGDE